MDKIREITKAPENTVIVLGYPKSSNTWLSRLLGDILDSPVTGFKNAKPIATEGLDRKGEYVIRQLHIKPTHSGGTELIPDAWSFNIDAYDGTKLVHVIRDPRDVAVSAMYYWDLKSIKDAINAMAFGTHPLKGVGKWNDFVRSWQTVHPIPCTTIFYERLHNSVYNEIFFLLGKLGIPRPSDARIHSAIERQEFKTKKALVARDGDKRPDGKEVQVKNMRKGIVGDWKNHFTRDDGELAQRYFGDTMLKLGYVQHRMWWMEEID